MARDRLRDDPSALPRALGHLRVALDAIYVETSRDLGLTAQQAELLCAAMRPAAVGEIAQALRCDRSNVTRLADRASARGLLRRGRDESDGRVTMIELSPDGRELAERFIAALESRVSAVLADWPGRRRRELAATLHTLAAALEERQG